MAEKRRDERRVLVQPRFLPMSRAELAELGWDEVDILLISGDACVDHPSFGIVLLARWLIAHGFRTGLVAQPRWDTADDLLVMGRPRLFCGIGAGCVDSMVAHYSAFRAKRRSDAYTPGGRIGARPNRATIVYANLARRAFPGLALILGGIEASTRRVTHYDFWTDSLRRPILFDAKADLLVWGMGERAILEVAHRCARGEALIGIPGTAWLSALKDGLPAELPAQYAQLSHLALPSHEELSLDRTALLSLSMTLESHARTSSTWAYEAVGSRAVVLAPPASPLTTSEMDALYDLPFSRKAHPSYTEPVPAEEMLATSITSHRGCGGGCSFCSLAMHQGRKISSRSEASLLAEAARLAKLHPRSRREKGVAISDVGGPTANMWMARCRLDEAKPGAHCKRTSCCYPKVCRFFHCPQEAHVALLRKIAALDGVRSVRVASGVRPDLALREPEALLAYIREFTGGQLKLAPEHSEASVLRLMRKPPLAVFERFLAAFQEESRKLGREQYVVPYLMSAFPGCTDEDMRRLAAWLKERHWSPQQTQCFIPTPGTVATAMFYAACSEQGEPLFVARTDAERLRQHRLLMGSAVRADPSRGKNGQKTSRKERIRRN